MATMKVLRCTMLCRSLKVELRSLGIALKSSWAVLLAVEVLYAPRDVPHVGAPIRVMAIMRTIPGSKVRSPHIICGMRQLRTCTVPKLFAHADCE
jgi:hypothetical protein